MEDLSYPIGKFVPENEISDNKRQILIDELASAPEALRAATMGLTQEQLDTPYRPGGWTIRQVVHHLPDSHMNAYIRFKLALTEKEPIVKSMQQQLWASLPDGKEGDIEMSLKLFEGLHQRFVFLLRRMKPDDFRRTFRHPETGIQTLDKTLQLYAWHGKHHIAHITSIKKRMGW